MGNLLLLPTLALIDEARCIGCTKCLPVCPTDAIIGSAKMLHTVVEEDCTGCGECTKACPVNCIELLASMLDKEPQRDVFETRNLIHQRRMQEKHLLKLQRQQAAKKNQIKTEIQAAVLRNQLKKR